MGTVSAAMKAKIQTALGAGGARLSRDDEIDFVLEVQPVLLSGPSVTPLYFSCYGYSRVTGHKESPPRLTTAGSGVAASVLADSLGSELPDGSIDFAQFQTGQLSVGQFEIANPDGEYDHLVTDYGWGNAVANWKVVRMGDDYTDAETFLSFLVRDEPRFNYRTGAITFEAKSGLVNYNAPIQSNAFAGSGGWEGSTDLDGQLKPLTLGVRRNVPLTLVDFANQRYVVSDGVDDLNSLVEGYEKGNPDGGSWTFDATTAANGGMTLPNQPQSSPVTAHIQGNKFDGGAYSAEQGKIIEHVIDRVDNTVTLNATDRGDFTDSAGIHIPTNNAMTLGAALDYLRLPMGFGPYPEQDGSELRLGTIAAPADPSPSAYETYDHAEAHIQDIDVEMISPPVWKVRVGYLGLDVVVDNPLDDTAANVELLSNEYRFEEAEDATVKDSYPEAVVLTIFSPLSTSAAASTAATSLLAIFKVARWRYRITLAVKWFHSWIGDTIKLVYPRFGTDSGKWLLVTGVELAAGGKSFRGATYTMECWG